jgi:hypothetical protein
MFRNRVRPPSPPLDEVTAERLLCGAPIEELPEAYRPLGLLLADASGPANEDELLGSATAAAEFVAAHEAATTPRRRTRSLASSVLLAFTLAATTGTAVAATQGALPQPIQQVAHEALGAVGITVPGITRSGDQSGGGSGDTTPAVGASNTATTTTAPGATTTTAPTPGVTPAGDQNRSGDVGDNPNAGGNGNANPGEGNQGQGGEGGQGSTGNQGNPGTNQGNPGSNQGNSPGDPGSNLPSQSNGKGNGPPEVPPGQVKSQG